jgi:hypothetical protein
MGSETFDRQRAIEFAIDLEEAEVVMGEGAAMGVTCEQYGIDMEEGYDWLISLGNCPWWLDDNRLTDAEREQMKLEWDERTKATGREAE